MYKDLIGIQIFIVDFVVNSGVTITLDTLILIFLIYTTLQCSFKKHTFRSKFFSAAFLMVSQ